MRADRPFRRRNKLRKNPSQKQVERALQKSEEKFSKAFHESPTALTLTSAVDDRYIEVNETFEQFTGWSRDEVIGRTPYDIGLWVKPKERVDFVKRLLSGEQIRNLEVRFRTRNLETRTALGSAELIEIDSEPCVLSVIADVTDLKRTEEKLHQKELQLVAEANALWRLSRLSTKLWRTKSLDEGLSEMLSAAIDLMHAEKGDVVLFDERLSTLRMVAHSGFGERYVLPLKGVSRRSGSAASRALLERSQVVIEDVEKDKLYAPFRRAALEAGYRAVSSTPLISGDSNPLGVISTYFGSPHRPSEANLRRFDLYAQQAAAFLQRHTAEIAMRESEQRFRRVANKAPVMIWMSATDKLCDYFNDTWLEFTGRAISEELGNGWAAGVHPEDFDQCLQTYSRAFDEREPFQMEYRLRRHDGAYRWVLDSGIPRFNSDGSFAGYIGSAIDVTERKNAEILVSSVSQRLIEAQEAERSRIARELHDDINQRIGLLAVNIDRLEEQIPMPTDELKLELAEVGKQLADLGKEVQAISHRLYSSKLEYLGLATSAASFCREFSEHQKAKVGFFTENVPRNLPYDISLGLFRVLQEALQNAIKHSGSREFQVRLVAEGSQIHLSVHDSGAGFDPKEAQKATGIGITSMTERMKLVNGTLAIESALGRGTTIHAYAPMVLRAKSAGAN